MLDPAPRAAPRAAPRVRLARPSDLRGLRLLDAHVGERDAVGVLLVLGSPAVGLAHLVEVEGHAHLDQLSVHQGERRRGVGTALLAAVRAEARWIGHDAVTLCTDAAGPARDFFEARGFSAVEWPDPWLAHLLAHEDVGVAGRARVAMRTGLR